MTKSTKVFDRTIQRNFIAFLCQSCHSCNVYMASTHEKRKFIYLKLVTKPNFTETFSQVNNALIENAQLPLLLQSIH